MKVIQMEGENFKRLKAIKITPVGSTIEITGKNEQGKTSVLDLIWAVLAGSDAMKDTPQPIRQGEKAARGRLDLGEFIVSRSWTDKGTYLKVESPEGAVYPSPQALLDKFIGKLSFDPLAFSLMKQKEQRETLLGLVKIDLDLDAWALERSAAYESRTLANRRSREVDAQLIGLGSVPAGTPDEEVSAAAVLEEQAAAQAVKEGNDEKRREAHRLSDTIIQVTEEILGRSDRIKQMIEELQLVQEALEVAKKKKVDLDKKETALRETVFALVDPDLSIFAEKLAKVENVNRHVRTKTQRAKLQGELDTYLGVSKKAGLKLDALDRAKAAALKTAAFPIEGLAFDDEGVTYKGIPFSQCSAAERLRVSLAMAMALNPRLKVLRITDGSLLDSDNLQVIREMVEAKGYQCWLEKVSDGAAGVGVVIEDGMVKE